jgi:hypothetical protein
VLQQLSTKYAVAGQEGGEDYQYSLSMFAIGIRAFEGSNEELSKVKYKTLRAQSCEDDYSTGDMIASFLVAGSVVNGHDSL